MSSLHTHRLTESDFRYSVAARYHFAKILHSSPVASCDVISSLYALSYLVNSTFVLATPLQELITYIATHLVVLAIVLVGAWGDLFKKPKG